MTKGSIFQTIALSSAIVLSSAASQAAAQEAQPSASARGPDEDFLRREWEIPNLTILWVFASSGVGGLIWLGNGGINGDAGAFNGIVKLSLAVSAGLCAWIGYGIYQAYARPDAQLIVDPEGRKLRSVVGKKDVVLPFNRIVSFAAGRQRVLTKFRGTDKVIDEEHRYKLIALITEPQGESVVVFQHRNPSVVRNAANALKESGFTVAPISAQAA